MLLIQLREIYEFVKIKALPFSFSRFKAVSALILLLTCNGYA